MMGTIKFVPENEMQTREWFAAHLLESEYDLVGSQAAFPDWVLRDEDGKMYRVEVEYKSASFNYHGHDPRGCDFVLCWIHDARLPLPVLELSTNRWYGIGLVNEIISKSKRKRKATEAVENKYKKAEPVKTIEGGDKKWLLEIVNSEVSDEYNAFLFCYADDLRAMGKFLDFVGPARLELQKATWALILALRNAGVAIADLHPRDLFELVTPRILGTNLKWLKQSTTENRGAPLVS